MRSASNIRKIILTFGIFALVSFSLLPQITNAAPPQRALESQAAYGVCSTYGADSQQCKDATAKAEATAEAELNPPDAGATLGYYVAQIVYVFTVGLGSAVAYVAANVLNLAVHISLDSAAYGLDFISLGWTMLRDIANMAFIFILIYIAMKVMFEAHTAGTIGLLAKVLAVALVINFSFFATRLVIDAGNLISVQFYNAVVAEAPNATVQPIAGVNTLSTPDITAKIMGGVNFQSALNVDSFGHIAEGSIDGGFGETFIAYSFIYIVLGAMLFMLAAAFIAAGIKFIVRIVMLWFAIVTAPIALVAWSFQGGGHGGGHGGGYFSKWSKNLVSHAFYPAVFLFVMLLISNFMSASGDAGFGGGLVQGAINNGQVGSLEALGVIMANIAVRLGFVLVMLYFALKASDYFEVAGAGFAKQFGDTFTLGGLRGYGRRFGILGGATVSRTAGAGAYSLNKTLTNTRWGQGGLGTTLRKGVLQPVAGASVGGARSFSKIQDDKKAREKEYKTGIRDVESHELVHAVAHSGSATDDQAARLKKLSKRELEHLSEDDATAISGFLTEDQIKIIKNADGFTEKVKESAETNWHEKAGAAPLQKADKLIQELQDINKTLGDIDHKSATGTIKLSELMKSTSKINKTNLVAIKETFSRKMDEARVTYKAGESALSDAIRRKDISGVKVAKDMMTKAQAIERNSSEAIKKAEKAIEETEKIPANPTATPPRQTKGEFTKK